MHKGGEVLDRGVSDLLGRSKLQASQMLQAQLVGRFGYVLCELLDEAQIVADGAVGLVTALEFFEHHFGQVGHCGLPSVTTPYPSSKLAHGACGFVLTSNASLTQNRPDSVLSRVRIRHTGC